MDLELKVTNKTKQYNVSREMMKKKIGSKQGEVIYLLLIDIRW